MSTVVTIREHKQRQRKLKRKVYKLVTWLVLAILFFIVAFYASTLVQAATWEEDDPHVHYIYEGS